MQVRRMPSDRAEKAKSLKRPVQKQKTQKWEKIRGNPVEKTPEGQSTSLGIGLQGSLWEQQLRKLKREQELKKGK